MRKQWLGMILVTLGLVSFASATDVWNFESDLGGFYSNNSGLIDVSQSNEAAFGGSYSMKLDSPSGTSDWVEVISWFWSDWSDKTHLNLKFKAGSSGLNGTIYYSFWDWNQNGWANGGGAVDTFSVPSDDAWHTISLDMSSYTRNSVGGVRFYTNGLDAGAYYIDDITAVPEPMTMSLLTIGGLGVLLRRRK